MLKISIIAKDKILYQGEASSVIVPTQTGIIEVLQNHMSLISALSVGEIILTKGKKDSGDETKLKFTVQGGVLEVRPQSNVIILVN